MKWLTSQTPPAIMVPRKTSAPMMPQNSSRCWKRLGTPMARNSSEMTNRLLTLSDSSSR